MHFNIKQLYTPALEPYEFNENALIVDTETVGAGPTIEIIEIAFGDVNGHILYETLVRPIFNPLPVPSKHQRFERTAWSDAPHWTDIWPQIAALIDRRLLIAYNAPFDRRAFAATCSRYQQSSTERGWRCAMPLVKKATGTKKSLTLSQACAHFGLAGGNHRAGQDVRALHQLLKMLLASTLITHRDKRKES